MNQPYMQPNYGAPPPPPYGQPGYTQQPNFYQPPPPPPGPVIVHHGKPQ